MGNGDILGELTEASILSPRLLHMKGTKLHYLTLREEVKERREKAATSGGRSFLERRELKMMETELAHKNETIMKVPDMTEKELQKAYEQEEDLDIRDVYALALEAMGYEGYDREGVRDDLWELIILD